MEWVITVPETDWLLAERSSGWEAAGTMPPGGFTYAPVSSVVWCFCIVRTQHTVFGQHGCLM